jgi:hypothetical protein
MSQTQSTYGERWFEFDRAIGEQMERENQERQYNLYVSNGGTMTIEEWENDGRYDKHDWG